MSQIHIGRGTTNLGDFTEEEVRAGIDSGRFFVTDLGWREGMEKWKPLSQFEEFSQPAAVPPPIDPALAQTVVPPAESTGLPWDFRREMGGMNAWLATLKLVLMEPTRAFTAMHREGGLIEPLYYALIGGTIGGICGVLYQEGIKSVENQATHGPAWTVPFVIGICVLMPLILTVSLFVSAALIHVSLLLLGGATRPFETTFRTVCFGSGSTSFLQIIPVCGVLFAFVWHIVAVSIGISKTHEISTGKAVTAVLLPLFLCCGLAALAVTAVLGGVAAAGGALGR